MCDLLLALIKLKKSSAEAVDNDRNLSTFKKYMHVERKVQNDLEEIIEKANSSSEKSLVLVCGNVGDGKSHLISYLKNEKHILNNFEIHNDATESYREDETEKQTLAKVMSSFNDQNINNDNINEKLIVAINLGVLSNFINSKEGENFQILKEYVNCNGILTDDISVVPKTNNKIFHVNFGDYHLYRLKEDTGVDSPYISKMIDKIFGVSDKNIFFYQPYKKCKSCEKAKYCPIKMNYEMLSNELVKANLIDIILETIIKDKLILSTRELLNFFYDIVVHPKFSISKIYSNFEVDYTTPNILFGHDDISSLLSHVRKHDFVNNRDCETDKLISLFYDSKDRMKVINDYVADNPYLKVIDETMINNDQKSSVKKGYLLFFLRLIRLCGKNTISNRSRNTYLSFLKNLFYYNVGDVGHLKKEVYKLVKHAIYKWTNSMNEEKINFEVIEDKYYISTSLKFVPNPASNPTKLKVKDCDNLDRFSNVINLKYLVGDAEDVSLSIDYELYEMLIKINNGYSLTAKDKTYYASFCTFVNRLLLHSNYASDINISFMVNDKIKRFRLFDDGYGLEFKEEDNG